jgi:hypothetical protein
MMPQGMPGMGVGRPAAPRPTKPVIRPVKKLQAFNWRRVLVLPQGTAGKKENIWDAVTETPLNQEEMEELFENKVIRNLIYLIIVYRKKR